MNIRKMKDSISGKNVIFVWDFKLDCCREQAEALGHFKKAHNGYFFPDQPYMDRELREIQFQETSSIQKAIYEKEKAKRAKIAKEKEIKNNKFLADNAECFAFAESVQQSIIQKQPVSAPKDSFTKLMNHQRAGSRIAEMFDKFAFFYDTGTGKTLMALDIIYQKEQRAGAHFLILCPKTIINPAWMQDQEQFYPQIKLLPLSSNISIVQYRRLMFSWHKNDPDFIFGPAFWIRKKRERDIAVQEYMKSLADHLIVNYEMFRRNPDKYMSLTRGTSKIPIDGIIIDESSIPKNDGTEIYSVIQDVLSRYNIKYLYLFSGKPAPNALYEYYSQIQLVAPDLMLPPKESIIEHKKKQSEEFMNCIKKVSITVSKQDCFDLPPTTQLVRKIHLDKSIMQKYHSMAALFYTKIQELEKDPKVTKFVVTHHILGSIAKLRQLTGGFIIDNEKKRIQIHKEKLNELLAVIRELGVSQAIIWCQYQHEVEAVEKALNKSGFTTITAYGKTKDKDSSIQSFISGKAQFLIAHPRTLQYGVTLTNCNYAIYYSTSYSFEEYYQSHDRIYRYGQSMPCTYIFLQVENTIDEIMFQVIMDKKSRTEATELFLKHLSGIGNS